MTYSRLVIAAACAAILCLGGVVLYFGRPAGRPQPQPSTGPALAPAPSRPALAWTGLTVRGAGPIPRCGDEAAVNAVTGLLRGKAADPALSLANIHVAGHFQIGDVAEWDCDAEARLASGPRGIVYRITQSAQGQDLWQAAVSDAPARP